MNQFGRYSRVALMACALFFGSRLAHSESAAVPAGTESFTFCNKDRAFEPSGFRRGAAIATAIVPGVAVHGAGHWVAGHSCTALHLAGAEALGLTGAAVGGLTIAYTGASRYLAAPAITLSVLGAGLLLASFAADIYGTSGAARYAGNPALYRPVWEIESGLMHISNPLIDVNWLMSQGLTTNIGSIRIGTSLDTSLSGCHGRYRLDAALRAFGPRPRVPARDGSFFDLHAGITEQRYVSYGFVTDTAEILAAARLDLNRVGPTLRGSFAELSSGFALSHTRYTLDGLSVEPDTESLLLGGFAFGTYLGKGVHQGSEALFYYDHRHDDYAAGLKLSGGVGSGQFGHFGLSLRYFFSRNVGIRMFTEVGSAYVAGASLLFRAGGQP